MCQCGCREFTEQGPEAALRRAIAIIKDLGVTVENAQRYEDGERILGLIAPKVNASDDEEVRRLAELFAVFHQHIYAERSKSLARAAREVFADFPAEGSPGDVFTAWHQLEELTRGLGEDVLSTVGEAGVAEIIRTVQHIHENPQQRRAELLQRHNLQDP